MSKYNKPSKSQVRNDKILRFCCKGYKSLIDIADHIELSMNYTKTILKELLARELVYIHTTSHGEGYHTEQSACIDIGMKPRWD